MHLQMPTQIPVLVLSLMDCFSLCLQESTCSECFETAGVMRANLAAGALQC